MTTLPPIDPAEFIASVQPLLQSQDLHGLLALLKSRYTSEQITKLLRSPHEDARKVAALAIGLVGGKCCIKDLSALLKDPDPIVNQMVEHALWSIWFRCGSAEANHQLARGAEAIERRDFDHAVHHLERAIQIDPTFAEAYNQRAIASYLQEHFEQSIEDCQRAVERMPCHFGAWAGMGHCYAHEGRLAEAVEAYEQALRVNPHLDAVRQVVETLRRRQDDTEAR